MESVRENISEFQIVNIIKLNGNAVIIHAVRLNGIDRTLYPEPSDDPSDVENEVVDKL